jgi:hypothetical protein
MLQFVGVTSNPAETKTTSAKESHSNIAGSNTYARMVVYHVSRRMSVYIYIYIFRVETLVNHSYLRWYLFAKRCRIRKQYYYL